MHTCLLTMLEWQTDHSRASGGPGHWYLVTRLVTSGAGYSRTRPDALTAFGDESRARPARMWTGLDRAERRAAEFNSPLAHDRLSETPQVTGLRPL